MWLVKRTERFHTVTVSVCGGIFHNVGQLFVAALVVENYNVLYYMPVLLVAGILTGFVIGILADELGRRLKFLFRNKQENQKKQ